MKMLRLLIFLCPTLLTAQSDSVKTLPSVEITSQRINHFALGQMRIDFDSNTLRIFKNSNLANFLQANTPLSIKAYGTGLATVSTRGTGSSHTAIVWNGFNIQNALNGLVDLPLNEAGAFEHIGVQFGGSSALYGSGAIGGAIYLDNDIREKRGFHGELGFLSGSYGLLGQNMAISTGNSKVAGAFRLSHQASRNEFIFKNTADIGQPLQYAQNAAFEKFNLTSSFFFNIKSPKTTAERSHFLKINIWESRNNRQISPTMTAQNDKAKLDDANSRIGAEWSSFKGKSVTKARFAYFDEDNLYRSTTIDSSRNRVKTTIGEVEHNIDLNNKTQWRFGLNFTQNQALTQNFDTNKKRTRLAAFAAYNFAVFKTDFSAAIRQELVDNKLIPVTFSLGFLKNLFNSPITHHPSPIANNYQSPITNNYPLPITHYQWILRGSVSKNYNLPTLNDLYWTQLGNPNLKAENSINGELGIDFKVKQGVFTSKMSLTGFMMLTKDRIQWSPKSDGLWHPSNVSSVFSRGIEVFYTLDFYKNDLNTRFNLTYQLARSTDSEGKQLLYTPLHTGNASLFFNYKKSYFQYNQSASSRRYGASDNSTWTNAFTIGNATIGHHFSIKKAQLDINFKINNVFDNDYQVIAFYANPKREYLLTGSLKF